MATSDVQICSLALMAIGHETITSLNGTDKASRFCKRWYNPVRQEILRMHTWNFATVRDALVALNETPEYGYSYVFQLPNDLLRLIQCEDPREDYRIQGRKIYVNNSALKIEYIRDETDANQFDALFVQCLVARLAMRLASSLGTSEEAKKDAKEMWDECRRSATFIDASEGNGPEYTDDANEQYSYGWLDARN